MLLSSLQESDSQKTQVSRRGDWRPLQRTRPCCVAILGDSREHQGRTLAICALMCLCTLATNHGCRNRDAWECEYTSRKMGRKSDWHYEKLLTRSTKDGMKTLPRAVMHLASRRSNKQLHVEPISRSVLARSGDQNPCAPVDLADWSGRN